MPGNPSQPRWKPGAISLVLVLLVLAAFGQTVRFGYVNVDDPDYVYANPMVLKGISLGGIGWAFTHVVSHHWHPLTMMSLMLDCQIFGSWAGGHHLVNMLLHAANAALLFLLLLRMTGALWRSAFVAAVFAIHPLRVESVAWVSERKDVLSGLFFMLTLWAYVQYVRSPKSKTRYSMVLLWFALGLMSKPMLVTTPFVLLLLDYWPLGRLTAPSQFLGLLREKIPLFILSALSSVAAVLALKSGGPGAHSYPANVPVAYVAYLGKLFYPSRLATIYPLPKGGRELWEVFDSLLLLAAISAGAWLLRRKQPYALIGWLWYLGMLVPVTGVMQLFDQAYADRYTYLPQIGVCVAITWMAADWAGQKQYRRATTGVAAGLILSALFIATWRQTGYWRDSETLWTRTIECTHDNFNARNYLGMAMLQQGRTEEAIDQFRESLRINAVNEFAEDGLGDALLQQGHTEEAIVHFRASSQIDPSLVVNYSNLGVALFRQGHTEEAIAEWRKALQIDPSSASAHNNLGTAFLQQGHTEEAIAEHQEALRLNPNLISAHKNLAKAFLSLGDTSQAIAEYERALQLSPNDPVAQCTLAWLLATARESNLRDGAKALELATRANTTTGGTNPLIFRTLAAAYAACGDFSNAVQIAQNGLKLAIAQSNSIAVDSLRGDINLYEKGQQVEDGR